METCLKDTAGPNRNLATQTLKMSFLNMADRSSLAATVIAGVIFGTVFLVIKPGLALILSELFATLATISSMILPIEVVVGVISSVIIFS